jgi:hypothetical protein
MSNLVSGWLVGLVLPGVALAQGAATAEERERLLLRESPRLRRVWRR